MVHRIHNACLIRQNFHDGLTRAKDIWEANQYPPSFFNPIVRNTLEKILRGKIPSAEPSETRNKNDKIERKLLILPYRGKPSDKLSEIIWKSDPVNVIFTTRKLKTALPSLKPATPKELSSRVIYQFTCSSCNACYVGQTSRHLKTRVNEHLKEKAPVGQHLRTCGSLQSYDLEIIDKHYNVSTHVTLESLYIAMLRPEINGKQEYTSRPFTVKLWELRCRNWIILLWLIICSNDFVLFYNLTALHGICFITGLILFSDWWWCCYIENVLLFIYFNLHWFQNFFRFYYDLTLIFMYNSSRKIANSWS